MRLSTTTILGNATSTFGGGISLASGCFAVSGTCITASGVSTPFGQTFEINGTGYLAPTTTITLLANNGFISQASSTIVGLATLSNLLVTGSTTLQNFTANFATTSQATTTNLAITGVAGSLLKTLGNGAVVAAQAGVDYQAAGNYATFGYLFPSNATTTQLAFNGGLTAAGATSTSLAVTGSTTISSALNSTFANVLASTTLLGNTLLTNATTTNLNVSGQFTNGSGSGLALETSGVFSTYGGTSVCSTGQAAVSLNGSGVETCSNFATFAYPFPSGATSSLVTFTGGILVNNATSTITNLAVVFGTTTNATSTNLFATNASFTGATTSALAVNGSTTISSQLNATGGATFANFTGALATLSNLLVTGSTTLQNFTANFATTSQATTTNLAITGVAGSLLKTLGNGAVVAAVAGTDYLTPANIFAYPFPSNATTTQIAFNGGATFAGATSTSLAVTGSTTISSVFNSTTANNLASTTLLGRTLFANATGTALAITGSSTINTLNLTNALSAAFGGTGSTTLGGILAGNGAGAVKSVVVGSGLTFDGTTLATNGSGITAIGPTGQTQTGGTQILATTTSTFNGLTAGITIVGNSSTQTFTPTLSGTLDNTGLTHSSLTVSAGSGLTGGGSVSLGGSTSLSLDLTSANAFTALQQFNGGATTTALTVTGTASTTNLVVSTLAGSGTSCVQVDANGKLSSTGAACGTGSGSVNSVTNSDGTLTFSPTTGAVVGSLNLGNANTWTALQQFKGGASTTVLSAYSAFFGATATSSFNGSGDLLVVGSTTLQNFTANFATTSQATTTNLAITGVAGSLLKTLGNGAVVAAQAGVDYQAAGNYATFGYLFPSNATTTQIAFNGGATFAGATSTSLAVTGSTTINTLNLTNALGPAFGGTGSTTLGGLLTGNGTGALTAAVVNSPLSFSGNTLSISQANASTNGYLSSIDWDTFNNKISSTSLSGQSIISYTGSTGVITTTPGTFGGSGTYTFPADLLVDGNATTTDFSATLASTTNFIVSSVPSSLLKTTATGAVVAAQAGVDYQAAGNYATFGYLFPSNATTTQLAFNGGLTAAGATSTSLAVTGSTTISSALNSTFANVLASTTLLGNTLLTNATTTNLNVSGQFTNGSGSGLALETSGVFSTYGGTSVCSTGQAAVSLNGSGVETCSNFATFAYPFPSGATSSLVTFTGGILVNNATSTITNLAVVFGTTTNATSTNLFATNASFTGATTSALAVNGSTTISSQLNATGGATFANFTGALATLSNLLVTGSTTLQNFTANFATTSQATTTNLAITGVAGSLLKTLGNGAVVAAVAGTDYLTPANIFAYPFPSNATTTQIAFNGGATFAGATSTSLAVTGSTTISSVFNSTTANNLASTTLLGRTLFANATGTALAITGSSTINTLNLTNALSAAFGGTGSTTLGGILAGNGAGAVKSVVVGSGLTFDGTTLATNGSGITAIGPTGQTQTGGTQILATTTSTFNGLTAGITIVGNSSTQTFTPTLSGTLDNTGLTHSSLTVSAGSGLTGGGSVSLGGSTSLSLDLTSANAFTALQQFNGGATTTALSAYNSAFFGGTATSSFNAAGALTLASALSVQSGGTGATSFGQGWLYSAGGSSALAASTSPTVNYLFATSTTATSTFSGGLAAASSLFVLQNGNIGIGNSSPIKTLDVNGTGKFSSTLTLAGTLSCVGGQALQTDSQGNISCGTVTVSGASTGGGWTTNNTGFVTLATTTDLVAIGATSTPYAKLTVLSGGAATTTLALVPASGQTADIVDIYNPGGALSSVLTAAGNLGLGTTSPSQALSVQGNTLFSGDIASVANITATGTATIAGNLGVGTTSPVSKFAVSGGDITQVASGSPMLASTVAGAGSDYAYNVYVSGRYAYEADYEGGLRIVDTSNPKSPTVVGQNNTYVTFPLARAVVVAGKYAYVADENAGLVVFDVSNPSAPAWISTYALTGTSESIAMSGKYVFINDFNNKATRIIDVSNPANPTLAGTFTSPDQGAAPGSPFGLAVQGKYLYIADFAKAIYIVDISTSSPSLVGTYHNTTNSTAPVGLYVSGKYLYVADDDKGFFALDVSNPASPTYVGNYPSSKSAHYFGIQVAGNYAYVADNSGTLTVLDISNISSPQFVGSYATGDTPTGVFLSGKYAYVANQGSGLDVIDINGIQAPAANIGSLESSNVNVSDTLNVGGDIYAGGGLDVGLSGINSRGALSVLSSTTLGSTLSVVSSTTIAGAFNSVFSNLLGSTTLLGASLFNNATTSTFAITGVTGSLLKTLSDGAVVAAVAGTDYSNFAYPFPSNATSTELTFTGGILVNNATSTITNLAVVFGTTTNATSTNLFATNASFTGATTSALAVTGSSTITGNFNAEGTVSLGQETSQNATTTNFAALGSSTITGAFNVGGSLNANGALTVLGGTSLKGATSTSLSVNGSTTVSSNLNVGGPLALENVAGGSLLYNNGSQQLAAAAVGNGLTFSAGTLATSFGTTTNNIWTSLQQFAAGASTTELSVYNGAFFGATATSTFTNTGNLGIGTTSPYANVSIADLPGNIETTAFAVSSSTAGFATTTLFSISNTGLETSLALSTGGATTTALAVNGSSTVSNILNSTFANILASSTLAGNTLLTNATTTSLAITNVGNCSGSSALNSSNGSISCGAITGFATFAYPFTPVSVNGATASATSSPLAVFNASYFGGTGTTTITSAGFLGVGTTSPYANLSIINNASSTSQTLFAVASSTNSQASSPPPRCLPYQTPA